jgi:hypothetical protein
LFLIAFVIYLNRELVLRQEAYAQFVLGTMASAFAPILTVMLLSGSGHKPILGLGSIWQWTVMALAGGVVTPLLFRLFDCVSTAFAYQPMPETSFRSDREIKRRRL